MSVEVVLDTPLANALNSAIQPKLAEVGWSTGDDASALSEYIILMLVNGKTQEQIAAELSGDLLNLGENDPGAREFSQWLFHQIDVLSSPQNGDAQDSGMVPDEATNTGQDEDMGDATDSNIPTGPKSMRNGPINIRGRDKRMLGHLSKAMDRSHDSVLHRVRPQNGSERINTHSRGLPSGPRQQGMPGRANPRALNNRMNNNNMRPMPMMQGNAAANIMNMNPQQQMDLYTMLEQQSRLMAQVLGAQPPPPMGRGGPMPMGSGFPQQPGRSLFDRAQPNARGGGFQRGGRGGKFGDHQNHSTANTEEPSSSMDVEMSQEKKDIDYENTVCRFNLTCTNKDCKYAHQSPAAPPGTTIDFNDVCSFGAACKNRKCVGKHPSPAQKVAHQTEQDCKFFPNCTNKHCPFRHPSMPLCRNGADCTTPDCKFTHSKVMCKFNPCLNPTCTFKHIEGQKRGKFEDKVWTADGAKEHVSERKFVDETAPEELIVPGTSDGGLSQVSATTELIT